MEIWKGAESFSHRGDSKTGILVSQGFTGTTSSVIYLAKFFAEKGYNVECPRLTGHGTRWEELNKVHYTDWIGDVEGAYKKLKEDSDEVFVAGLSMGGALVLYLEEMHPEIKGGILINHALIFDDPRIGLLPILKYFVKSTPAISNDVKDPTQKELAYDKTPTAGAHEMIKLTKLVIDNLSKVMQPQLIFKSREDHVVPLKNVQFTFDRISSKDKEVIWLENSYHVATMDFDKDIICEKSLEFVKKHTHI
ncbi:MAG: alpha/beta hydrolase [Caldisericaceae bacterium]